MSKQIVLLLIFALVVSSVSAAKPPYSPLSAKLALTPPYLRPGYVERPFANFSSNQTKATGRDSDVYPNWTPLVCDGSENNQLNPNSPKKKDVLKPALLLINNDYFYIYYDTFVICVDKPQLLRGFTNPLNEKDRRDIRLTITRPVYAWHSKKPDPQNYLSSPEGFNRVRKAFRGSMEYVSEKDSHTILILEEPEANFFWVDFRGAWYGQLHSQGMTPDNHKRLRTEHAFVRFDYQKWWELTYSPLLRSMKFYYWHPFKNRWMGEPLRRSEEYTVDSYVYWDNHVIPGKEDGNHWHFDVWWGSLVELDTDHVLHFHTYVFKISENDDGDLAFVAHHYYDIPLADFLGCQTIDNDYRPESRDQLKGVMFRKTYDNHLYTLVFLDQFYYSIEGDMMRNRFFLTNLEKKTFRVQFEKEPFYGPVEMVSTKYVKHFIYGGDRVGKHGELVAFDEFKAYQAPDKLDKSNPMKLVESRTNTKIAQCRQSTFTIVKKGVATTFCFDKREYYGLSNDPDVNRLLQPEPHRIPIENIFKNSNVDYGNEDIEYIFEYNDPQDQPVFVVFMTYHYLLVFKKDSVFSYNEGNWGPEIQLNPDAIFSPNYVRNENCLWTHCQDSHEFGKNFRHINNNGSSSSSTKKAKTG